MRSPAEVSTVDISGFVFVCNGLVVGVNRVVRFGFGTESV